MARVFLMCVGTRDPVWAEKDEVREGPILTFFRLFFATKGPEPVDRVYLFSTRAGSKVRLGTATERRGEATKSELQRRYRGLQVEHRRFPDIDPSEFPELVDALLGLARVAEEENPGSGMVVNTSPGTPQMQAAWYALVHSGQLVADLYRVIPDPVSGHPGLARVDLAPFAAADVKRLAFAAFGPSNYQDAARLFGELARLGGGRLRRAAGLCERICKVYWAWISGDHQLALGTLEAAASDYEDLLRAHSDVGDHVGSLQRLVQERRIRLDLRLADLCYAATHRLHQGEYADAFWRLSTVVEQIELERARQVGFSGWSRSEAHRYLTQKKVWHALADAKEEDWLFRVRNEALHRGVAISEKDVTRAGARGRGPAEDVSRGGARRSPSARELTIEVGRGSTWWTPGLKAAECVRPAPASAGRGIAGVCGGACPSHRRNPGMDRGAAMLPRMQTFPSRRPSHARAQEILRVSGRCRLKGRTLVGNGRTHFCRLRGFGAQWWTSASEFACAV
jgi:hypothetical protein